MRKEILCLAMMAMAGCTTKPYNSEMFRYDGEDSVVECEDYTLERMCEKDGKTLANGLQVVYDKSQSTYRYIFYRDGVVISDEWRDPQAQAGMKSEVSNGGWWQYTYCKDDKLCAMNCMHDNIFVTGKELQYMQKIYNGKLTCTKIHSLFYENEKVEELLKNNYRKLSFEMIEQVKEKIEKDLQQIHLKKSNTEEPKK